jgi:16S rRNA (cytosine967-C5)-methyltransferase
MNSRLIAARIINRVLKDGQSLTVALDDALQAVSSCQDRAFIQALCYGVLRQYFRLEFILGQLLKKPLKDVEVKAIALIGLYQLKSMRVKPHAAVSETVSATRRKPWAKSLINALLRNYLRKQDELETLADQNDSALYAHPVWLIKEIEKNWPLQALQILQCNNQLPPMVLRINLRRCTRADYLQQLADKDIAAKPDVVCCSAITLTRPVPVEQLPGFLLGQVSIQDTAAQLAAGLLQLEPGQRVLDVCAAPGGKTTHILEKQPLVEKLIAVDIDKARSLRIKENLQRLRCHAEITVGDAQKPSAWWDGKLFDRILLDAPCSALGVIRRHPDIKVLRRAEDINHLQQLQSSILKAAWDMLCPGGLLLYATCSILKKENEEQIKLFLAAHQDAVEEPIIAEWGVAREVGRQILTGDYGMDGFYYARLKKL